MSGEGKSTRMNCITRRVRAKWLDGWTILTQPLEILRFRLALSVDVDAAAAVDEHPFCLENEDLR